MDIRPISFRTLTPLWSGGEDRTCRQGLLETCILGSMRWWLEALARGYGIPVPDPTEEHDPPSCVDKLFSHTGQKRRSRLEIDSASVATFRTEDRIKLEGLDRPKVSGWYYEGRDALCGKPDSDGRPGISGQRRSTVSASSITSRPKAMPH